jgi:hypothetical protein
MGGKEECGVEKDNLSIAALDARGNPKGKFTVDSLQFTVFHAWRFNRHSSLRPRRMLLQKWKWPPN